MPSALTFLLVWQPTRSNVNTTEHFGPDKTFYIIISPQFFLFQEKNSLSFCTFAKLVYTTFNVRFPMDIIINNYPQEMYFCETQFQPLYMCTGIFILPLPEIIIFVLSKVTDGLLQSNHSFNFSNFLRSSSSSCRFSTAQNMFASPEKKNRETVLGLTLTPGEHHKQCPSTSSRTNTTSQAAVT